MKSVQRMSPLNFRSLPTSANYPLSAGKTLDERLLHAPETLILPLAQSSVSASTETVSSPVFYRFLPTCYLYYDYPHLNLRFSECFGTKRTRFREKHETLLDAILSLFFSRHVLETVAPYFHLLPRVLFRPTCANMFIIQM